MRRPRRSRGSLPRPTRTCGSGGASMSSQPPSTARCPFPVTCCGCESVVIICIRFRDRSSARRAGSGKPSSPLEGIARAQVAAGTPSTVRFQLMPVIDGLERRYRQRLHRHELRARRSWGRRGPLTLSAGAEIASGVEVQDRALFHLELQVAARDFQTANSIAASVMARRGENHLHRRYMTIRQGMYRRRFPTAYPRGCRRCRGEMSCPAERSPTCSSCPPRG